jgi:hypothetical protein
MESTLFPQSKDRSKIGVWITSTWSTFTYLSLLNTLIRKSDIRLAGHTMGKMRFGTPRFLCMKRGDIWKRQLKRDLLNRLAFRIIEG